MQRRAHRIEVADFDEAPRWWCLIAAIFAGQNSCPESRVSTRGRRRRSLVAIRVGPRQRVFSASYGSEGDIPWCVMFPEFDAPNRRRRKRWLFPAILVTVVVVFLAVGNLSSENLGAMAFYDDVRSVAAQQSATSNDMRTLVSSEITVDRDQFTDLMTQIDASLVRSITELTPDTEESELPGRVEGAQRLALAMLGQWQAGVDLFEEASLELVDAPDNPVSINRLGEAIGLMQSGDVLYDILLIEIEQLRIELGLPESELPDASYLPPGAGTPAFLDALGGRIASAVDLQGVRGVVAANILTIPEATGGEQGGIDRLPYTDTLEVQVVVANRGNVAEENVLVLLTVDDGGGARIASEQVRLDVLESQAETTVIFADIPVTGGTFYLLDVGLIAVNTGSPTKLELFIAEAAPVEG